MKRLSETWFAEGYIDFELKKYTLLAYLQEVNKYFNENKLYPQLADAVSSLAQHRILVAHDLLPALQQSHDGARSQRGQAQRPRRHHQMDSADDPRRSGVHGTAFEGMVQPVS